MYVTPHNKGSRSQDMSNHKVSKLGNTYNNKGLSQGCIPCSNTSTFEVPLALWKKCPFTDDLRIENGYFLSITLSNYQRVPSSQISGCKEKPHKFTRLISNNISTRLRSSKSQVSTGPTTSSQLDAQAHPQVPHSIHWLFIMFPNI